MQEEDEAFSLQGGLPLFQAPIPSKPQAAERHLHPKNLKPLCNPAPFLALAALGTQGSGVHIGISIPLDIEKLCLFPPTSFFFNLFFFN